MDAVLRLEKADAQQILESLPSPPSYSSVRALLAIMVKKGHLKYYAEGKKYVYEAAIVKDRVKNSAVSSMLTNLFEGSPAKAISTILNVSSSELSESEYEEIRKMIEAAEKKSK